MGSLVEGRARDVRNWLEERLPRWLKPCIEDDRITYELKLVPFKVHGMDAFPWCENGIETWFNPAYYTIMNVRLTIDKAGRIVIPKPLREELHLEPGDDLELESAGEEITLRPVRGTGPLTQEHGVWVFRTGQLMTASTTDEMLRKIREDRDLVNLDGDE